MFLKNCPSFVLSVWVLEEINLFEFELNVNNNNNNNNNNNSSRNEGTLQFLYFPMQSVGSVLRKRTFFGNLWITLLQLKGSVMLIRKNYVMFFQKLRNKIASHVFFGLFASAELLTKYNEKVFVISITYLLLNIFQNFWLYRFFRWFEGIFWKSF